ncbi:MAG: hypothetical protein ABFC57_08970, partial [Veillonellales bacterium]
MDNSNSDHLFWHTHFFQYIGGFTMQRKWKRRWQRLAKLLLPPVASGVLLLSAYSAAYANPAGGTVTSGAAAIAANGKTMTVTQSTDKAAINWQSFNIAAGEKV